MEKAITSSAAETKAMIVGRGVYAVNEKHLNISEPSADTIFIYRYAAG